MNRPRRRPPPRVYPGSEVMALEERIDALEERLAVAEGELQAWADEVRRLNCKLADGELP